MERLPVVILSIAWLLAACSDGPRAPRVPPAAATSDTQSRAQTRDGAATMTAGFRFSCGISPTGQALCWGGHSSIISSSAGAPLFGADDPVQNSTNLKRFINGKTPPPAQVNDLRAALAARAAREKNPATIPLPEKAVRIAAGDHHVCVVDLDGAVRCVGNNLVGQQGRTGADGTVSGLPPALDIAAGGAHTCILADGGGVWCWGANLEYQAGATPQSKSVAPTRINGLEPARAIRAGRKNTCALVGDDAWCWGLITPLDWKNTHRPARLESPGPVTDIALGYEHGCLLVKERVLCFGANSMGEAGPNHPPRGERAAKPFEVPLPAGAAQVVAGKGFTAARLVDGRIMVWGKFGQYTHNKAPRMLRLPKDALVLAAGVEHVCAAYADGNVRCAGKWGGPIDPRTAEPSIEPVSGVRLGE